MRNWVDLILTPIISYIFVWCIFLTLCPMAIHWPVESTRRVREWLASTPISPSQGWGCACKQLESSYLVLRIFCNSYKSGIKLQFESFHKVHPFKSKHIFALFVNNLKKANKTACSIKVDLRIYWKYAFKCNLNHPKSQKSPPKRHKKCCKERVKMRENEKYLEMDIQRTWRLPCRSVGDCCLGGRMVVGGSQEAGPSGPPANWVLPFWCPVPERRGGPFNCSPAARSPRPAARAPHAAYTHWAAVADGSYAIKQILKSARKKSGRSFDFRQRAQLANQRDGLIEWSSCAGKMSRRSLIWRNRRGKYSMRRRWERNHTDCRARLTAINSRLCAYYSICTDGHSSLALLSTNKIWGDEKADGEKAFRPTPRRRSELLPPVYVFYERRAFYICDVKHGDFAVWSDACSASRARWWGGGLLLVIHV